MEAAMSVKGEEAEELNKSNPSRGERIVGRRRDFWYEIWGFIELGFTFGEFWNRDSVSTSHVVCG